MEGKGQRPIKPLFGNFGGSGRMDGRHDGDEDIIFRVVGNEVRSSDTADRLAWSADVDELSLGSVQFRVQINDTDGDGLPESGPFNTAQWLTVRSTNGSIGDDGSWQWTYTVAQQTSDGTLSIGLGPPATPTSNVNWRVRVTRRVNGVGSKPLFFYPLKVATSEVPVHG